MRIRDARGAARARQLRRLTHRRLAWHWGSRPVIDGVGGLQRRRYTFCTHDVHGQRVWVKAFRGADSLAGEVVGLACGRAAGVTVPDVLDRIGGDPDILVLSDVPGRPLSHPQTSPEAWTRAGDVLRRLHTVPVENRAAGVIDVIDDWAGHWIEWIGHEIADAERSGVADRRDVRTVAEWARAELPALEPVPRSFLHGDFNWGHVLVTGETVGVIDFDGCLVGDPAFDVAALTVSTPERLDDVLAGYGAPAGERARIDHAVLVYWATRVVKTLNWTVAHGLNVNRSIANLERVARTIAA